MFSPESRKFFRLDIGDKCISHAVDAEHKHPEHDLRFCECCDLKIFIGDWGKHITTYEHQIHLQVRKRLLGFCWYGTPDIMPHEVKECQACQQRNDYIKNHVAKNRIPGISKNRYVICNVSMF